MTNLKTRLFERVARMSLDDQIRSIYRDALTDCWNRRAFDEADGDDCNVAIVDVDSLKWVNDNKGHRAGDALLIRVANHLRAYFGGDRVFRLSGDEFVVLGEPLEMDDGLRRISLTLPVSFGIGVDLADADDELRSSKETRTRDGLRAARGEAPAWA